MQEFWDWLAAGAGTVMLAMLAGAGGSALLELLWRPRRDRKRAATMLTAEVAMNTELLLLQSRVRQHNPRGVPADFKLSILAWEAAADIVSELPAPLLRKLVMLYNQYAGLNRNVDSFGQSLDEYKAAPSGSSTARDAETMLLRTLDVFNTGLDATLKRGQDVLPQLAGLAGIKETEAEKAQIRNYDQVIAEHMAMRQQHLDALRAKSAERKDV